MFGENANTEEIKKAVEKMKMSEIEIPEEEEVLKIPEKEKKEEDVVILSQKESMSFLFINNQSRVFK